MHWISFYTLDDGGNERWECTNFFFLFGEKKIMIIQVYAKKELLNFSPTVSKLCAIGVTPAVETTP